MSQTPYRPQGDRHHVVIIGAGFGGLFAAKKFKNTDVAVTSWTAPTTTSSSHCCTK